MYLKTEGIILKRRNFGEADRIITFYTKDFGKLTAIAKGVRRPRSKKAGHLEIGSWCKVALAKGKNLDLLTEVELKHAFGIDNFTEEKANRIYHLLEIIETLSPENQKNLQAYKLLLSFLNQNQKTEDFNLLSSVFKVKLMKNLGYFSAQSLKDSKTKTVFEILEDEDFLQIEQKMNLSKPTYLKLLSFLDSMIESASSQKLKTSRFV